MNIPKGLIFDNYSLVCIQFFSQVGESHFTNDYIYRSFARGFPLFCSLFAVAGSNTWARLSAGVRVVQEVVVTEKMLNFNLLFNIFKLCLLWQFYCSLIQFFLSLCRCQYKMQNGLKIKIFQGIQNEIIATALPEFKDTATLGELSAGVTLW